MRILIVDDNPSSLQSLDVVLRDLGHDPATASGALEAMRHMERAHFPLVITDIRMPGMDGLELLARIREQHEGRPDPPDVVLITGHGDMETAVEALRKGAYDYLQKPINAKELSAVVERSAEHQALIRENRDLTEHFSRRVEEAAGEVRHELAKVRRRLSEVEGVGPVVAQSEAMRRVVAETRLYHGDPEVPVLIEGETGTGKEVVARLIHHGEGEGGAHPTTLSSHDAAQEEALRPFVAINCAAIPAALFETELFGHEPGAYTGSARRGSKGKLELAARGTLFLDEVAELPLELQPKLLRVLEQRSFYRVGGVRKRRFEARIVCAAGMSLEDMVTERRFRRDLFHRLKVGHLVIPPLRERPEDIRALAELFLRREARRKKKAFHAVSAEALDLLAAHPWPGNVRELENAVERAVLTADAERLAPEHLEFLFPQAIGAASPAQTKQSPPQPLSRLLDPRSPLVLPEESLDLEALNLAIIRRCLDKFDGNKSKAAAYLGMSRYALHRRLEKER